MSFLKQLGAQASQLQNERGQQTQELRALAEATEQACTAINRYVIDLARHLAVIEPPTAQPISLDGKTFWPAMKTTGHCSDSRKKRLRDAEVFDFIAMGWSIVPAVGAPADAVLEVNFLPDLQRVEARLAQAVVAYERTEVRHPEKKSLLAYRYAHRTEAQGSLRMVPDHDRALLSFHFKNVSGLNVMTRQYPVAEVTAELLDEIAKLVAQQPSRLV